MVCNVGTLGGGDMETLIPANGWGFGQWTVDGGRWTVDGGRWTVNNER